MKKFSFIVFAALILFGSCNKEQVNNTNFHVSFKVDGVDKTFTGHVFAHRDTTLGYYELSVVGAISSTLYDNYMGFYINNDPSHGNFNSGVYTDTSTAYTVLTTYAINSVEYEAGQSMALDAVAYGVTIAHHFKVIITSIDNNTIRGTFSGDYYPNMDVRSTTKLNITNGDFYAKFQ